MNRQVQKSISQEQSMLFHEIKNVLHCASKTTILVVEITYESQIYSLVTTARFAERALLNTLVSKVQIDSPHNK